MNSANKEKQWLVKSSTRIMGPYSAQDIIELLEKRQIGLLDEIRKPIGRWVFIRENKEIAPLLATLKNSEQGDRTISMMTEGQTISRTENLNNIDDEDAVDPVEIFNNKKTEDLIKDIVPIKEQTVTYNTAAKPSNLTYGAYTEDQIEAAVENKTRPIKIAIGIIVLVLVVGYFGYVFLSKSKQSQGYQSLIASALRLKSIQLYEKSYQVYKKAKIQKEPDLSVQAEMALLNIIYDNDTGANRRIIEKYISAVEIKDRRVLVDYNVAIALSYLKEGDDQRVNEFIQKAAGIDPFSQVVILNRSLQQLKKAEYRDSYITLKRVNSKDELTNLLLYVKAYTLIEMSRSTSVISEDIRELLLEIPNQLQKSGLLRNELLLLSVKLQMILKNDETLIVHTLDKFLDSYPQYSKYLVKDPRIDWKMTQWEALERVCLELSQMKLGYRAKLIRARCLIESQNGVQAQKWLDEALAEAPNDPQVISTQIFWLSMMNKDAEAVSLANKFENRIGGLGSAVVAEICIENKDEACVSQNINKIKSNIFLSPLAYYDLAKLVLLKNQKTEALQNIKQGLNTEPLFLPLLELRESLESQ